MAGADTDRHESLNGDFRFTYHHGFQFDFWIGLLVMALEFISDIANIRKTGSGSSGIDRCFWLCANIRLCYPGTAGILYVSGDGDSDLERAAKFNNRDLDVGFVLGSFIGSLGDYFSRILAIFWCSRYHYVDNCGTYRKISLVERMGADIVGDYARIDSCSFSFVSTNIIGVADR